MPEPRAGEALIRVEAAGVNFIDVYHRTGLYKLPLPLTPGQEGAGVVEKPGLGVGGLAVGQRVAWASVMGGYAEYAIIPADRLVPVPKNLSTRDAAAVLLQGMTAHYLAVTTFPLQKGHTCLIHAAAGGVGLLLVQIAKLRGARVIATVGTAAKMLLAREAGADEVMLTESSGFPECDVVYDGVGKATFDRSLAATKPRGLLVMFGNASGAVPPFDLLKLSNGSKYVTRPRLADYVAKRDELLWRAKEVLDWTASGKLKVRIHREYPLADAAQAHRDLESRTTTGKLILLPG